MDAATGRAVLVGVASALATLLAVELVRGGPARADGARPAPAGASEVRGEPGVAPPAALAPLAERAPASDADARRRLDALEERMAAVEALLRRRPLEREKGAEAPEGGGELRRLVFDWIAEEREERDRERAARSQLDRRAQLEFDAGFQALMFAREHDLLDWQRERFEELFLEIGERSRAIQETTDPATDDPAEVEARWVAFDEWVDGREREVTRLVAPELYGELYGDD